MHLGRRRKHRQQLLGTRHNDPQPKAILSGQSNDDRHGRCGHGLGRLGLCFVSLPDTIQGDALCGSAADERGLAFQPGLYRQALDDLYDIDPCPGRLLPNEQLHQPTDPGRPVDVQSDGQQHLPILGFDLV